MNEFRILSIDELDEEFVNKLRVPATTVEPVSTAPESDKQENVFSYSKSTDSIDEESIRNNNLINEYLSAAPKPVVYAPTESNGNTSRPIIPLGQGKAFYSPADSDNEVQTPILSEDDFEAYEPAKKRKGNKGLLAAKISCIIMLALTIVVFIAGCFVSIYLNNDGVNLKGICFNTLATDVKLGEKELSKGDLIISRKTTYDEYANSLNKPIAIPVDGVNNEGCEIEYIYSVSNIMDDEASIITYHPETNEISDKKLVADMTYGIDVCYLPIIGGVLVFALNNAILVCVLFVLMAAFWCLLMILIEKNAKKKT